MTAVIGRGTGGVPRSSTASACACGIWDSYGEILDKSVTSAVNQGGGIEFTNDKPDAVITEAPQGRGRRRINKAKVLAEAAGVSLGRVIEIAEQPSRPETDPRGPQHGEGICRRRFGSMATARMPIITVNVTFAVNQ